MTKHTAHLADYCRFFSAEDACRIALGAYYAASRVVDVHARAAAPAPSRCCPPLAPDSESGSAAAPRLPIIDRPWFLGQFMQALSEKFRDDGKTAKAYSEIISRWEAEENTPENAQFATVENRQDNGSATGAR